MEFVSHLCVTLENVLPKQDVSPTVPISLVMYRAPCEPSVPPCLAIAGASVAAGRITHSLLLAAMNKCFCGRIPGLRDPEKHSFPRMPDMLSREVRCPGESVL